MTDGDSISRDYTIQQIQKAKESNYNFNYDTLIDFIKALPSTEKADGDSISKQAVIGIVEFECGEWKGLAKTIIKAIEQLSPVTPQQEFCEDCISRKAVLDEIEYELEMINSALDSLTLDYNARERLRQRRGEAREILNSIQQLPPVTPQPSAEKSAEVGPMQVELEADGYADGELVYDFGKCPNCGWEFEEGDKDWEEPYCCHCGQKLKWFETEEEE